MNENAASDDELESLVAAYTRHLEGDGPRPDLRGVEPAIAREARQLFALLEATWASDVELPPLGEDPVAIALGLVERPTLSVREAPGRVVGAKVAALRTRRQLRPSDLAKRLSAAGHPSTAREVVRLEDAALSELPVERVISLAKILGCSVDELTEEGSELDDFAKWVYSDDFEREVARWASNCEYEGPDLAPTARSMMLAGRRRSKGRGSRPEWLLLLRAILDSLR